VQGKLADLMHEKDTLFRNLGVMIQGAQVLGLPILWLEQNPTGLGATVPSVASLMTGHKPIAKMSFSAFGSEAFREALRTSGRKQVLLVGIEAHVCIYLTTADLLSNGYEVHVVADAVSSRSPHNKRIGLDLARGCGARITCVETVLFELLGAAEGPEFKSIIKLLR
jgi:hypothetical protein